LIIYDLSGTPHNIELPKNSEGKVVFPVTVKDANGNVYEINEEIDENGNTTGKYVVTQTDGEDEDMSAAETSDNAENKIKFEIKSTVYNNDDTYTSIYNNKILRINILSDENIDWTDLTVHIKNKKLTINEEKTDEDSIIHYISIQVNESNLKSANKLEIKSVKDKKTLSKLKINTYNSPTVKFDRTGNNAVDYLFDKGFDEQNTLKQKGEYKTVNIKGKDFHVPVLGIIPDHTATIKIDIDDFEKNIIKNDPNFRLVIKARINNKISIENQQDSLVLDYAQLTTLKSQGTITITSNNPIDGNNLTSMLIDVLVGETREIVGQIECYSAKIEFKTLTLIFVQFKDDATYPNYVTSLGVQNYLNTQSLNQLFVNCSVDEKYATVNLNKSYFSGNNANTSTIMAVLEDSIFNNKVKMDNNNSHDYYCITNLDITMPDGKKLGGAHWKGKRGGYSVKNYSTIGETNEELIAHELGHWLGLPHTFESDNKMPVINSNEGGTNHNFMDYNIRRKRWYKIQLINIKR
jgi:hypothetical protein